jgi:Tfp pilus assembly PilM family ATPase
VSPEEAEKTKNEKGIIDSEQNQDVFGCLMPAVTGIRDEISKHLDYWNSHRDEILPDEKDNKISKIILCGSQSMIPGINDYLSGALRVETTLGNPWSNVIDLNKYIPPLNNREALDYATAIGLAIENIK